MLAWPPALGSLASGRPPSLSCSFQSHKTLPPEKSHQSAGPSPGLSNGCGQLVQTGNSFSLSTTESCVLNPNCTPSATKGYSENHPMGLPGPAQSLDGGGKSDMHSSPAPGSTSWGCSPVFQTKSSVSACQQLSTPIPLQRGQAPNHSLEG